MWKLWAFSKINKPSAVTSYNNLSKYDADFNPVQLLASAKCCWHFASATTSPKPINFFKTYWKHLPASLLFIVQENTEVTVNMADFSSKLHLSDVYCLLPFKPFFFCLLSLSLLFFQPVLILLGGGSGWLLREFLYLVRSGKKCNYTKIWSLVCLFFFFFTIFAILVVTRT